MTRSNLTFVELLLAAIFLVMIVPMVTKWSEDNSGVTRWNETVKQTRNTQR